jgi:hypothetical protein
MGSVLNEMKKSIVLYLINDDTPPYFVPQRAFRQHFDVYEDFDWHPLAAQLGLKALHRRFIDLLQRRRPEYCFMQIQDPAAMHVATIREMANYTKIIHWTGDIRDSGEWYDWLVSIGKEVYLTLFTNETDVKKMREKGVRADYLQIGFDDVSFSKKPAVPGWPAIVFAANNYDCFPLSQYRAETTRALYRAFPNSFRVFGSGWQSAGIQTEHLDKGLEAECYNSCKLALSISNLCYERYYSDRLLRIMACGCCAVSHCFPELEKDFTPGTDILVFRDHQDLIDICHYYLVHDDELRRVGENALVTAHTRCTWDVRISELIGLLHQYG